MGWTLETAVEALNKLLSASTYNELQLYEQVLSDQGVSIGDDYVETVGRQKVLLLIKQQFQATQGPSVVLSGWYGSGKTTVMRRIIKDFVSGELTYGAIQVDPIEIRLNEQNTMNLFLASLFNSILLLTGEDWLVETYRKKQQLLDVPELDGQSADAIRISLQRLPISRVESVVEFLEEVFREYKRYSNGKRVVCLVIDELENITMAAQQPEATDYNKLVRLLQIFLDNAAREYIDNPANRHSPFVLVIFSVLQLSELEASRWLRQDTADRCASIHRDINLTPATAEFLMKSMLRIYLTGVMEAACNDTTDGRLHTWKQQIQSASKLDDPLYTYPITPEVHLFISRRILIATPVTAVIRRYRAYQITILTLLKNWAGEKPIDMRFVVAQSEPLRFALAEYADGVEIRNIIDSTAIGNLIKDKFKRLKSGQIYEMTRITEAAITRTVAPVVNVSWRNIEMLTGGKSTVTEAVFPEILKIISQANVPGWTASADMLSLEISTIIEQLGTPATPISEEETIEELLQSTALQRGSNTLIHLLYQSIADDQTFDENRSNMDDKQILHVVKRREPLVEEYLLAFDSDRQLIQKLQSESIGLIPGILFTERVGAPAQELPFNISVLLPQPLDKHRAKYADNIRKAFTTGDLWERVFLPLISAIMKFEQQNRYQAFQEALKVVGLFQRLDLAERQAFKKYQITRPLLTLLFNPIELSSSDNRDWICSKLGFKQYHDLDPTRRLTKVLSWTEGKRELLLYETADEVQSKIRPRIFQQVILGNKQAWQQELEREWSQEWFVQDFRLKPYPDWPQQIRDIYERVNKELIGKTLSFYQIGKLLFGQCQIDGLPTAVAALHLFLKLGQIHPLGWKLSDDVHETYEMMTVTPTDVLRETKLRQTLDYMSRLKNDLVICCCIAAGENRENLEVTIRWLSENERGLDDNVSVEKLDAVITKLGEFQRRSLPQKAKPVDQQTIQKLSLIYPKLGEYLSQLGRIIASDGVFPLFVSQEIGSLLKAIESDLEYEFICYRIGRLFSNWSKQYDDDQPDERALKLISDWYSQKLQPIGAWAVSKTQEFEKRFTAKVNEIREHKVSEDLAGIRDWVQNCTCEVVLPGITPTFTSDDHQRIRSKLKVAEDSARSEISEGAKALRGGIVQAQQIVTDPSIAIYRIEIEQKKNRMQQVLNTLEQASSRLFTSPFGQVLKSATNETHQWASLYSKVQQTKEQKIKSWLSDQGITEHETKVLAQFPNVRKSIQALDKEWLDAGIDILKKLKGGPSELLTLIAASRLLRHLEGGDQ